MHNHGQGLNAQILSILKAAGVALSASEIQRSLPGDELVEPSVLSCRLTKLIKRGEVVRMKAPRRALTGPLTISLYTLAACPQQPALPLDASHSAAGNIFQLLPQTQ